MAMAFNAVVLLLVILNFYVTALAQQGFSDPSQTADTSSSTAPASQQFYQQPAFTAMPASQRDVMPIEYSRYVQQPATWANYYPSSVQTYQQQSLGASERTSVKTVVGLSVLGGILLAKILAFVVKPALVLSVIKKVMKSVKAPVATPVTTEGRMLSGELPDWAHSIFSVIEGLADKFQEEP